MTFPMTAFGGTDIVLINDHRLRDAIFAIVDKPFPAPVGADPLTAFAAAMASRFPPRDPRDAHTDISKSFHASLSNGMRLCYLETRQLLVLPTALAMTALTKLDVIRSNCGATMVRGWPERQPAPAVYCHYCGCLV